MICYVMLCYVMLCQIFWQIVGGFYGCCMGLGLDRSGKMVKCMHCLVPIITFTRSLSQSQIRNKSLQIIITLQYQQQTKQVPQKMMRYLTKQQILSNLILFGIGYVFMVVIQIVLQKLFQRVQMDKIQQSTYERGIQTYPYHMYQLFAYSQIVDRVLIDFRYQYQVESCFQIFGFRKGENLLGQPQYKSGTRCGNFTTYMDTQKKFSYFFQVRTAQMKQARIYYTLHLIGQSLKIKNQSVHYKNSTILYNFSSYMLRDFPNLPIIINRDSGIGRVASNVSYKDKFFSLNRTQLPDNPKGFSVSESTAYLVTLESDSYCLQFNKRFLVQLNFSQGAQWFLVTNFTLNSVKQIKQTTAIHVIFQIYWHSNKGVHQHSNIPLVLWDSITQQCKANYHQDFLGYHYLTKWKIHPGFIMETCAKAFVEFVLMLLFTLVGALVALIICDPLCQIYRCQCRWPFIIKRNQKKKSEPIIQQQQQQKQQPSRELVSQTQLIPHQNPVCTICFETGCNYALVECFHSFHFVCIRQWVRTNPMCPNCKRNVRRAQVQELMHLVEEGLEVEVRVEDVVEVEGNGGGQEEIVI